ncbi:hypothetical protein AB0O58_21055 [Rhodococcus sp. NPDC080181]|uniref:hypothetical protein n=1 Tax=Rhodococcus sp. NPDC080181 TaxID=3155292 RepID=UPI0034510871
MATKQILARAPEGGSRTLEWVEPGEGLSSNAFAEVEASARGLPLRLGTEMLLRFAAVLRGSGFSATDLELADGNLRVLTDPNVVDGVVEDALDLLHDGSAEDVVAYFRTDARYVHVIAVEMRLDSGGGRVTLRRNGWVTVHDNDSTPLVKSSLQTTSELVGLV